MVGLHHQLSGLEFKQNPGDSEGQGSLVCCSPWGQRVGHNLVTKLQTKFVGFIKICSLTLLCQFYDNVQFYLFIPQLTAYFQLMTILNNATLSIPIHVLHLNVLGLVPRKISES